MNAPPAWSVQLSPAAMHALLRLPHRVARAIALFVNAVLPVDPDAMSTPLRFELDGWCVARRGSYRVVFRALPDDHVLYIGRIEHPAHAYLLATPPPGLA